jgi:uncharacterized protein (TIGR02246 family)
MDEPCTFVSLMRKDRLFGPKTRQKEISMKAFFVTILACALAGCATSQGSSGNVQGAAAEKCKPTSEQEIASLFDRWNQSLLTGDPQKVVANYAKRSILLPTVSNEPRLTSEEKDEYFVKFLKGRPSGKIDKRIIFLGCNSAVDAGLYTFTFGSTGAVVGARYTYTYAWDGAQWLITSHHSSAMPEK